VVIAMALACRPALIVLDEPTTGLDVTTQWRILSLLAEMRDRFDTALLYVSHDLGALAQICDRIAVMYAGAIVETAPAAELFEHPRHPYSRGLLGSLPRIDVPPRERAGLRGMLKREELPPGCRFAPRCDHAEPACFAGEQRLDPPAGSHQAACRRWRELVPAEERGAHVA
jgi:oligopeptide/dipeptide ABC transporter ATP-binding protein